VGVAAAADSDLRIDALICIGEAEAQEIARFFELEKPGHVSLRLFGASYGAKNYDTTHEGFELSQTITQEVSFVGRAIVYQNLQRHRLRQPADSVAP
jgi:hypothetical protein